MGFVPEKVDSDIWCFAAAEKLEESSLVRDEILSEQRGRSHLYRRKPKAREMSAAAIGKSLQIFNSPKYPGAGIGERRERISQILVNHKTASESISKYLEEECKSVMEDARVPSEGWTTEESPLFYPVSDELLAALIVSGGPKKAMDAVEKYNTWHQTEWGWFYDSIPPDDDDCLKKSDFELPELSYCESLLANWQRGDHESERGGFDLRLPAASLICNEREAKELIDYVFTKIEQSVKNNYNGFFKRYFRAGRFVSWIREEEDRKEVIERAEFANYRIALGGDPDSESETKMVNLENLEDHSILGLLLRKYPSLIEEVSKYGWTSVAAPIGIDESGREVENPEWDWDDDECFPLSSLSFWHLSRSIVP